VQVNFLGKSRTCRSPPPVGGQGLSHPKMSRLIKKLVFLDSYLSTIFTTNICANSKV
jgi:hypothetical protein